MTLLLLATTFIAIVGAGLLTSDGHHAEASRWLLVGVAAAVASVASLFTKGSP